jgi:hypothetical protein
MTLLKIEGVHGHDFNFYPNIDMPAGTGFFPILGPTSTPCLCKVSGTTYDVYSRKNK